MTKKQMTVRVIVETAKGVEYGTVVFGIKEVLDEEISHPLKPVLRKATPKDEQKIKNNEAKIPQAIEFANARIREMNLEMKLVI